ncbi:Mitochondrial 2-oxoglutarate/malate carrier protein [Collichthys lucidus]|uniref:Citrate transport protein n=1 Tax=Collichthys lucidus TaxID=240159 RepID=A0A4U5TVR9_COLLU|nr:Mitochondrial 2-oxoglutarate/malate carrier protein [Collichthys lucidus]
MTKNQDGRQEGLDISSSGKQTIFILVVMETMMVVVVLKLSPWQQFHPQLIGILSAPPDWSAVPRVCGRARSRESPCCCSCCTGQSRWTVRLRGHRQRVDRPAQRTQAAGGPSGSEDTGSGWTVRLRGHRQRWTVRLRGHRQRLDRPAQRTQAAGGPSGSEDTGSGDRTRAIMAETKPKTSPKAIKFLFGGLAGMGATVFVQPLDLVKNRMQLSGQGTKAREYKTSFHALFSILKNEGVGGIYTGYLPLHHVPIII